MESENAALHCGPGGLEIEKEVMTKWDECPEIQKPFKSILTGIQLSSFDSNPLSMNEAHPDKQGNAVDWGGREIEEWMGSITMAGKIIATSIPEWWKELPLSLQRIIPVGFDDRRHLSASYKEAIGLAYVSLHPDPMIMAEAIIHETQHNKLNALFYLDPILSNGFSEWTASPVRPDLRPLNGVLLAAHAFIPVAAMYLRLAKMNHPLSEKPSFSHRWKQIMENNAKAMETLLGKAMPSKVGATLLKDLDILHKAILPTTNQG
jgi:HEXXH motif-containing protein